MVAVQQKNYFGFARLSIVFAAFPGGGIDSSEPSIDGNSQHAVFSGEILTDRPWGQFGSDEEVFSASRIRLLPNALIDQIAAGEVVERPASVVKELVENALDAEARRIRIELREGGNDFIAIVDDGHGMTPENARLALRRHATSKITSQEDLERIGSFGFRGEALPAIASVSRLRLLSRPREADTGHEVRVEGGEVVLDRAAGCPVGTRIEVANLFGQIPARRKFLKKPATEWGHAYDWLMRLALSLPGVHFEVIREDREAGVWPATDDSGARIGAVLGHDVASRLIPVTWEERGGRIEAWLSPPDQTRANTQGLYLYVNGRPVRDRLVRHAVLEAYRDWLPRGRYPVVVLEITLDPAEVDVNVHPAKWEVRFAEPRMIHSLVRHAVREAMSGRTHLIAPSPDRSRALTADSVAEPLASAPESTRFVDDAVVTSGKSPSAGAADWLFAGERGGTLAEEGPNASKGSADPLEGERALSSLPLLGQMLASYLLLEAEDGLILVDQHAAHERVLYERLRENWLEGAVPKQGLLIALTIELDPLAVTALGEDAALVEALGFEVERFGEAAVVVRAIPALLSGQDPARLVEDLAQELSASEAGAGAASGDGPDRASTRLLPAMDRLFATLACHSARRFGDHLPIEEQRAILEGLDSIPWAQSCPHGRPVARRISRSEIERRFGRS